MKQLPTKISKSGTTHQSSTVSGQREMLRELRNKVNELIDYLDQDAVLQINHQDDWDSKIGRSVSKSDQPLYDFVCFCGDHPKMDFWDALWEWEHNRYEFVPDNPYTRLDPNIVTFQRIPKRADA